MKKFMADFDVREKAALIAAVILAWLGVNLVFAFVVNVPRSQKVGELDQAVAHATGLLANKQDEVARLREHYDRVMLGRTNLETFYSDVLSTKQQRLISFQKEIREIANRFHISLDTITYPREEYPKDKVAKFSATMPLTGSYESLREFIDTVEKSQNFIVIEGIQLASSKEGGVILSLNISLSTYFVDPEIQQRDNAGVPRGKRG
ncbi:MAG TPA: type 4a pilus biogenesis protein PilO [Patescibacteria group bacterium]|jgi:Tfp pilus assembly protein PilO|nr:type 4a pilus biogenesis protein PilO [Patescibacteria group bacterium]